MKHYLLVNTVAKRAKTTRLKLRQSYTIIKHAFAYVSRNEIHRNTTVERYCP